MHVSLAKTAYNRHLLHSATAQKGGVIRRLRREVELHGDLNALIHECEVRGWHVMEAGAHIVLVCHEDLPTYLSKTHLRRTTA